MRLLAKPFATSGDVPTLGSSDASVTPYGTVTPFGAQVVIVQEDTDTVVGGSTATNIIQDVDSDFHGITYTGFTSVNVYNGTDSSGTLVFAGGAAPVATVFQDAIRCDLGIYVSIAGTGHGAVFV